MVVAVVGVVRRHLLDTGGGCTAPAGRPAAGAPCFPFLSLHPARPPWPPRPALLVIGGLRRPSLPCPQVPSRPGKPWLGRTPAPLPSSPCRGSRPLSPASVPAQPTPVSFQRLCACPRLCPRPPTAPCSAPCAPLSPALAPCSRFCTRPRALPLATVSFPCPYPFPALCPVSRRPLLALCPAPLPLALVPCPCPCPCSLPRAPWPVTCVRPWALPLSPPSLAPRSRGQYSAPPARRPPPPGSRAGPPAAVAAAAA